MEFISNKDIGTEVEITMKYTSWNREWMMAVSQYEAQLSLINWYIYYAKNSDNLIFNYATKTECFSSRGMNKSVRTQSNNT